MKNVLIYFSLKNGGQPIMKMLHDHTFFYSFSTSGVPGCAMCGMRRISIAAKVEAIPIM